MAYTIFGGGPADVTTDNRGVVVGGVEFTVWTHATGGQRVTDLRDTDGQTLPGRIQSATTAADPTDVGRIRFQAPDTYHALYLDRGYGDRWQVVPATLGQIVATAVARSQTAITDSAKALTDAAAALAVARAQVDVRQFGAIGNGVTDDTGAFIAALAELKKRGGGTLFVPPLTFRIAGHIPLVDNVSIDGWGATFVKHGGTRSSYAYFSALSRGARGYGSGCRNVRVAGIRFTGDFATDTTTCAFGLHHAQDVVIEQCHFDQMQGGGHCIDLAGCENITIRDCRFTGYKEHPEGSAYRRAEAIQVDISANGAPSVTDQDGSFDGLMTRNVLVESCTFEPLTLGLTQYPAPNPIGSHAMREGQNAEHVTVRGCTIGRMTEDSTSAWRGGIHFSGIRGFTFENNRIHTSGNARIIGLYATDTGTPAAHDPNQPLPAPQSIAPIPVEDVQIRGNTFVAVNELISGVQEVIYIKGAAGGNVTGVEISGNRFALDHKVGEMIRIEDANALTVRDNHAVGTHMALVVRTSRNVTASGNRWESSPRTAQSFNGQPTEQYSAVKTLVVDGTTVLNPLDQAIWVGNDSEDVTVNAMTVINPTNQTSGRGQAISIAGAKRFTVTGCKLTTNNTVAKREGIFTYGSSAHGLVTGNIVQGFDAKVNTGDISTVTASGNI